MSNYFTVLVLPFLRPFVVSQKGTIHTPACLNLKATIIAHKATPNGILVSRPMASTGNTRAGALCHSLLLCTCCIKTDIRKVQKASIKISQ